MGRPEFSLALTVVVLLATAFLAVPATAVDAQEGAHTESPDVDDSDDAAVWRMPPMNMQMPMLPGLEGKMPTSTPYLPGAGVDPDSVPRATFRKVLRLSDGDTVSLRAELVRRTLGDRTFIMFGYNGQYPGPLLRVPQGATIIVEFENELELPTTVHWHGLRLDNRFDGVPDLTQEPVDTGETFVYEVHFPDAGIYWYHPHIQESLQQDLGLYGNMLVDPEEEDHYAPVNREEILILDDLLIDEEGLVPWGLETPSHALMGRFGNVFLVNGQPDYRLEARRGEVVRYFLTNASNTRTFNLLFQGAEMKVVAADIGRFERETFIDNLVLGPAQRLVVDVLFDEDGTVAMTNTIQAIDHYLGRFYPREDTLGAISVDGPPPEERYEDEFNDLREPAAVGAEVSGYRSEFGTSPDRELQMTVESQGLHPNIVRAMRMDTLYVPPVEWNDAMPMMNWLATGNELRWILRDVESGKENMDIDWSFEVGDVFTLRLFNDPTSLHPMQHPIHLHGQRFLVLGTDGVRNENMAWKDTAIVPVGSSVDLLVEITNPGEWMLHCHIAEHVDTGMMMSIDVAPEDGGMR